ncbi:MAG TPA: hypothetical protein VJB35_00045 [Candidatus Nanoarchaeia archaeon]|nr:hypothetical protein [Candidatus Nanoarchaeia archaeon]
MNENLFLVGTQHHDLDGKERLDAILTKLSPSIIALEFHKDRENQKTLRKLSKEEQQEIIFDIINGQGFNLSLKQKETLFEAVYQTNIRMGYELTVSQDYIKRNPNSRLEYIDISLLKNGEEEFVKGYIELATKDLKDIAKNPIILNGTKKILDKRVDAYLNFQRINIQRTYENRKRLAGTEIMRDPEILKRIKKDISPQAFQVLKQVYNLKRDEVMGRNIRQLYTNRDKLVAIVGQGHLEALNSRLEDLNPRVMTLLEYDSI